MSVHDPLFNFYSVSHRAGLGLINTWLQGAQRVRQHQLEQIGAALSDYEHISRRSDVMHDASEWQVMQQALVGRHIEKGMTYWAGLITTLGQNQIELAQEMRSRALQVTECLCQSVGEVPPAVLPQFVASSLKTAFNAASVGLPNSQEQARVALDAMAGGHRGRVAAARVTAASDGASNRAAVGAAS